MARIIRKRSEQDLETAKSAFGRFFRHHPEQANPTDPTTREAHDFIVSLPFPVPADMQYARKKGFPWARPEFWKEASHD